MSLVPALVSSRMKLSPPLTREAWESCIARATAIKRPHSDEAGLTRPALLDLRDLGAERLEALDEMAVAALDGLERGHARLPFRRKARGNQRHP